MLTLDLALDLDAPILPSVGAAGLRVGARLSELPPGLLEAFSVERRVNSCVPNAVLTLYRSAAVTLYVTNRLIDQIAVSGAYQGTLRGPHGSIGLGSTVADVAARIGPVVEDDEDNLSIRDIPGLCFEVEGARERFTPADDPLLRPLRLTRIFVHRF